MGIKSSTTFHSFAGGLISPKCLARYDLPFYPNSASVMQNFIPHLQGPARFREGTRYVRETEAISILHPFIYADDQAYCLEFTHRRMRAFRDGALVKSTSALGIISISGFTFGTMSPGGGLTYGGNVLRITTTNPHGLSDYDEIVLSGINGPTEVNTPYGLRPVNGTPFRIRAPGNPRLIYIEGVPVGAYVASPDATITKHSGCPTPYRAYDDSLPNIEVIEDSMMVSATQIPPASNLGAAFSSPEFLEMQFAQAFDTMFLVHLTAEPRKIVRTTDVNWTCGTYARTADFISTSADYPQAITFHEQRLIYGGIASRKNEFKASKAGAFTNHTAGSNATDAFSYVAAERRMNEIRTMLGNDKFLAMGCSDGSLKVAGPNESALAPNNPPIVKAIDNYGVGRVTPVLIEKDIIYAQKDLKKIRAISYELEAQDYLPDDLCKLADEILRGRVKQMAYQEGNPGVLWIVLWDGGLVGLTRDTKEGILAWHKHSTKTGHKFKSVSVTPDALGNDTVWFVVERLINGNTKYFIETMDLQKDYPRRDDYHTGTTAAAKLVDDAAFDSDLFEAQKYGYHLDCGLSYFGNTLGDLTLGALTGAGITCEGPDNSFALTDVGREIWEKGLNGRAIITAFVDHNTVTCTILRDFTTDELASGDWYLTATTVTGLDHLEGELVSIVADGAIHTAQTVTGGQVTINHAASVIHVGLPYIGRIKTTNIESGGVNGPAQSKPKNVHKIVIKFLDTVGAKYGTSFYNMENVGFRQANTHMGVTPLLFSGESPDLTVFDSTSSEKYIHFVQDQPLPCTVQMIVAHLSTGVD